MAGGGAVVVVGVGGGVSIAIVLKDLIWAAVQPLSIAIILGID